MNILYFWLFCGAAVQGCYIRFVVCGESPPPLCVTGRGKDLEEGQEEDPQQAVRSGKPQEEEGVC